MIGIRMKMIIIMMMMIYMSISISQTRILINPAVYSAFFIEMHYKLFFAIQAKKKPAKFIGQDKEKRAYFSYFSLFSLRFLPNTTLY